MTKVNILLKIALLNNYKFPKLNIFSSFFDQLAVAIWHQERQYSQSSYIPDYLKLNLSVDMKNIQILQQTFPWTSWKVPDSSALNDFLV